jgi:hypothetical protein
MSKQNLAINQIEIDVTGAFTTHHFFRMQGDTLGELRIPAFSQQGTFVGGGRELLMQRKSLLGSTHELIESATVRGTADRRALFSRDIVIQFDGQEYVLEPEGLFSRGWFLLDAEGATLLEIRPRGVFRQGAFVTIKGKIGADLIAFVYYLVHMRQQEDAAAVAATAAS